MRAFDLPQLNPHVPPTEAVGGCSVDWAEVLPLLRRGRAGADRPAVPGRRPLAGPAARRGPRHAACAGLGPNPPSPCTDQVPARSLRHTACCRTTYRPASPWPGVRARHPPSVGRLDDLPTGFATPRRVGLAHSTVEPAQRRTGGLGVLCLRQGRPASAATPPATAPRRHDPRHREAHDRRVRCPAHGGAGSVPTRRTVMKRRLGESTVMGRAISG